MKTNPEGRMMEQFPVSPEAQQQLSAIQQSLQQKAATQAAETGPAHVGSEIPMPQIVDPDNPEIPVVSKTLKTYYCRHDGSSYYFRDGSAAKFVGGVFHIDPEVVQEPYTKEQWAQMVKDLDGVCKAPASIFSLTPVPLIKSDLHILREVGRSGGSSDPRTSGTGIVGSTLVSGILAQS